MLSGWSQLHGSPKVLAFADEHRMDGKNVGGESGARLGER